MFRTLSRSDTFGSQDRTRSPSPLPGFPSQLSLFSASRTTGPRDLSGPWMRESRSREVSFFISAMILFLPLPKSRYPREFLRGWRRDEQTPRLSFYVPRFRASLILLSPSSAPPSSASYSSTVPLRYELEETTFYPRRAPHPRNLIQPGRRICRTRSVLPFPLAWCCA